MKTLSVLFVTVVVVLAVGCSTGPPSPKPGSPAFFWAVAQESYRTGDVAKANSTLHELSHSQNAFASRARLFHLVVAAGLSQGYSELADAYESGATMNLTSPLRFRRQAANLRSMAASAALEFTQSVQETLEFEKEPNLLLSFPYPLGCETKPEGLERISYGIWTPEAEQAELQDAMLQRGVLLAVCRAVGSAEDPVKALKAFQTQEVRIPRQVFLLEMAKLMYRESDLFGPQRMDRPTRRALLCEEALQVIQAIPPTEETQELATAIRTTLKEISGV